MLHLNKQADAACARLADPDDTEALHDFRVAIRRARTWLRAYHLYLSVDKRLLKRLRSLARHTNAARDAEVMIEALQRFKGGLSTAQRTGMDELLARFERDRQQAHDDVLQHVQERWPALARDLGYALKHEMPASSVDFSRASFELAAAADAELSQKLMAIGSLQDIEAIHQARIAAKRLRYLLEPFREEARGVRDAVQRLAALQDATGELHDGHMLARKLAMVVEKNGAVEQARHVPALIERMEALQRQRFAAVQEMCLGRHLRPFLDDVELPIARMAV